MTVKEVSRISGVSIRTLHYYDEIGLLRPSGRSPAGYRLYGEKDLELLQQILLFRELDFSLNDIREIVCRPDFDRRKALDQQIGILTLRRERLDRIIALAEHLRKEENTMDFSAFDDRRIAEYADRAKEQWGTTAAWKEYEKKSEGRSDDREKELGVQLMDIFASFGRIRELGADSERAQALVKELQQFITGHYYTCTDDILYGLGQMYADGGEFTANIDAAGGPGTAAFVKEAIEHYCLK